MGRKGSGTLLGYGSSHLKSADRGKGTPEASTPQKGSKSKYRAIPCIVTEDLTLFTSEDIAQLQFAAGRADQGAAHIALKHRAALAGIQGTWFGSLKEGRRFIELVRLQTAGEISALQCQFVYELFAPCLYRPGVEGLRPNSPISLGKYIADFIYYAKDGFVVEDTKGVRTALYRWKKKHVEAQYGFSIRET